MTIGNYNRHQAQKKKDQALAAAFPQGIRCQKCLGHGHWSYQCKEKRKILVRPSRTQIMKKNLKAKKESEGNCSNGVCKAPKIKRMKKDCSDCSDKSSSDSSSDDSSSSDSSDSSSSSDSDSDSDSSSSSDSNSDGDSSD